MCLIDFGLAYVCFYNCSRQGPDKVVLTEALFQQPYDGLLPIMDLF